MSNALSSELPVKVPKIATASVSKPPETSYNSDFQTLTFLISYLLKTMQMTLTSVKLLRHLTKTQNKQIGTNHPQVQAKTGESAYTSNYIQTVTTNQMQKYPMLPHNVFHNSNVTINYNFK